MGDTAWGLASRAAEISPTQTTKRRRLPLTGQVRCGSPYEGKYLMKFGIHEPYESQSRNDADWRNEQYRFKFGNGYGASVIRGQFTYGGSSGLWELAVVGQDGQLDYETPITDDVLGYLSESDVTETLDAIAALAKPAEVSA